MDKKIYIISDANRQNLILELLNKHNSLENTEFISIDNFINRILTQDGSNIFKIREIIKQDGCVFLNYNDYDFIKGLKRFKTFIDRQINKDISLQTDIFKAVYEKQYLELNSVFNQIPSQDFQKVLAYIQANDFKNVSIFQDSFDCFEQEVVKRLREKNARLIPFNNTEKINLKNIDYIIAQNKRVEIEAIIQHYLNQKDKSLDLSKIAFVLFDQSYLNQLETCLKRYHFPYEVYFNHIKPNTFRDFVRLIDFVFTQNFQTYHDILSQNIIKLCNSDFLNYLLDFKPECVLQPFTLLNTLTTKDILVHDLSKIQNLEKQFNDFKEAYDSVLVDVLDKKSAFEQLESIFNLLTKYRNSELELKKLKSYIENNIEVLISCLENKDYDLWQFIKTDLLSKTIQKDKEILNSITITDINTPIRNKDLVIVLGLNQTSYNGFSEFKGYFDEELLSKYTDIFSLDDRRRQHNLNIQWIYKTQKLVVGYAKTDLSGKEIEESILFKKDVKDLDIALNEIEIVRKNPQNNLNNLILYETLNKELNLKFEIDQDIIEALMFEKEADKSYLKTSASALKTYENCQFDYLMKYGLGLEEKKKFELDPAVHGIIVHAVYEKLYQDNYDFKVDEIKGIITPYFKVFKDLYKYKNLYYDIILDSYLDSIIQTNKLLSQEINRDSNLKVLEKEYKLNDIKYHINDVSYKFKGVIDRIDGYSLNNILNFEIIDYKTSLHTTSKKDGLLDMNKDGQLALYALIIQENGSEIFGQDTKCLSISYYNVLLLRIKFEEYKSGRKELIQKNIQTLSSPIKSKEVNTNYQSLKNSIDFKLVEIYNGIKSGNFDYRKQKGKNTFTKISHYHQGNIKKQGVDNEKES